MVGADAKTINIIVIRPKNRLEKWDWMNPIVENLVLKVCSQSHFMDMYAMIPLPLDVDETTKKLRFMIHSDDLQQDGV